MLKVVNSTNRPFMVLKTTWSFPEIGHRPRVAADGSSTKVIFPTR